MSAEWSKRLDIIPFHPIIKTFQYFQVKQRPFYILPLGQSEFLPPQPESFLLRRCAVKFNSLSRILNSSKKRPLAKSRISYVLFIWWNLAACMKPWSKAVNGLCASVITVRCSPWKLFRREIKLPRRLEELARYHFWVEPERGLLSVLKLPIRLRLTKPLI